MSGLAVTYLPMGYYESQERRTEQLNVRVARSEKKSLEALAEIWEAMEREKTGDPEVKVTISDVAYRLLQVGRGGGWAELGGEPKTPAELEAMKRLAVEKIRASKQLAPNGATAPTPPKKR